MNIAAIRDRNLAAAYPPPHTSPEWDQPQATMPQPDIFREGFAPPCLTMTDHSIIRHAGEFHIFGTAAAPGASCLWEGQHHCIFHASTPDFHRWRMHPVALYNHPDHPFEATHCWPPFVMRHGAGFAMIYCGVDGDNCQCLCLATSADLLRWERAPENPVLDAAAWSWTKHRPDGRCRHCRDPHVARIEDTYYLYYTTQCADGYGAVGLAASDDLRTWDDLGPCYKRDAHAAWLPESPLVMARGERFYLFVSQSPGLTCFESDDPTAFHRARPVPVEGGANIFAPEVVDDRLPDRTLLSFHGPKGDRLSLGVLTWQRDQLSMQVVGNPVELAPWK